MAPLMVVPGIILCCLECPTPFKKVTPAVQAREARKREARAVEAQADKIVKRAVDACKKVMDEERKKNVRQEASASVIDLMMDAATGTIRHPPPPSYSGTESSSSVNVAL